MDLRRKIRETALQILFAAEAQGGLDPEQARLIALEALTVGTGAVQLDSQLYAKLVQNALDWATGAWNEREQTDAWIGRLAPQWPVHRQPGVDRNLLRLSLWEMTHTDAPPLAIIDEAIKLAREFSTERSPDFVNGVLDAAHKEMAEMMR